MGFGDSLKKWAQSKATEMLTADSQTRSDAAASADAAQSQARSDLGETLVRAAFPQLGELADQQEANRVAREQAEEQEQPEQPAQQPQDPADDPEPQHDPPAPSGGASSAVSFARAQLGEPYVWGADGPDSWDCSGLTKASYASSGIYIGTHSATNQYNTMAGAGKLVPYSQRQRGDLIFWGGGGDYYHVAIYLGGGQMIDAPRTGTFVREEAVWMSSYALAVHFP